MTRLDVSVGLIRSISQPRLTSATRSAAVLLHLTVWRFAIIDSPALSRGRLTLGWTSDLGRWGSALCRGAGLDWRFRLWCPRRVSLGDPGDRQPRNSHISTPSRSGGEDCQRVRHRLACAGRTSSLASRPAGARCLRRGRGDWRSDGRHTSRGPATNIVAGIRDSRCYAGLHGRQQRRLARCPAHCSNADTASRSLCRDDRLRHTDHGLRPWRLSVAWPRQWCDVDRVMREVWF